MRKMLGVLLALALAVTPAFGKQSKLHQRAENAAKVLYGSSASRGVDALGLCTITAYEKVSDGYLMITAGHCIDPEASHAPEDVQYFVGDLGASSVKDGDAAEIVKWRDDAEMDAAEIHIKTSKKYEVISLGYQNPEVEDKVFYVGFPSMYNKLILTGQVAGGPGMIDPAKCEGICKGRIVVQISGDHGASGSALISEKTGQIVGILEGQYSRAGVQFVPAAAIRTFLEQKATLPREVK